MYPRRRGVGPAQRQDRSGRRWPTPVSGPVKSGLRFSRWACMASTRSSVAMAWRYRRRSASMPEVSGSSSALSTACLASRAASGARLATNRATSITWSSQSRERTLWLTRPIFTAVSVSIRRPVSTISMVRWRPIVRVSRCVAPPPGISPSAISGWPNSVPSVAMTMSQRQRQLPASAQRLARHGGDRGRQRLAQAPPQVGRVLAVGVRHVAADGEHLLGPGDDHAAHVGVGVEALEVLDDLPEHGRGQGVAAGGVVHADQPDGAVALRGDGGLHQTSSRSRRSWRDR